MKIHKDLRGPVKRAVKGGWRLSSGGKHWKLSRGPDLVVISVTISDQRAIKNVLSDMKRKGAL